MSFTVDSRTDNFLNSLGVKFTYEDGVPYADLKSDWRTVNLGRKEPIDDDAVQDYAMQHESGSPFPAVILLPTKQGYAVLDGVQRLSAGELRDLSHLCAYVVSPRTSITKQHMIRSVASHRVNGSHTPDFKDTLRLTVELLYFQDNCTAGEIADALRRSPEVVKEEIRFQRTRRNMISVGYTGPLADKKWFCEKVGRYAEQTDWQAAPKPLHSWLNLMEKGKFKNGNAGPHIEKFFKVSRSAKVDRNREFEKSLRSCRQDPVMKAHQAARTSKSPLLSILSQLKAASTVIAKSKEQGEKIVDPELAEKVAETLRRIYSDLKAITPPDILYANGRRSSIYDKG